MNAKKNTKPTDTSAPPRAKMHPRKEQLNCRVSPLVKRLIKLEWERSCDSEGQAVEALVLRSSSTPEAAAMILAEAEKEPMFAIVRQALAIQQAQAHR